MDTHLKTLRIGTAVILCALCLRLGARGFFDPVVRWLSSPHIQSFFIYLETGRNVRFSPSVQDLSISLGESPPPILPLLLPEEPARLPVFGESDAQALDIRYSCNLRPDLSELLTEPLNWDLTGEAPTVLILHTHTTESYTKTTGDYEETSAYRTLDERYNMLSVGDALERILKEGGIKVVHDRELHDYPSYNGSYTHARKQILSYLAEYPSIRLVLDLHRDASGDLKNQFRPTAMVDGASAAQLMLVMGTNASGGKHPDWERNLSLGLKIQTQLERIAPGITRPISLRAQRFNQDLTHGSLLIEVGAAGNTHEEALRAAEVLGKAILTLCHGTES